MKNRKKDYPIHPDFKLWTKTHLSLEEKNVRRIQKMLGKLYDIQKSSRELDLVKYKIPSFDGAPLRMLLYTPKELMDQESPCLIYYHGGGFVLPAFPYHFRLAREYAKRARCRVLFAEYRLAPDAKFPTAPQDGFVAYQWLLKHAGRFQINPEEIVVVGDSAGGEIATVVCLMAMDEKIRIPAGQMLMYPAVSKGLKTESMEIYTDTPMCNSEDVASYEHYYVGDINAGKWEYISPIDSEQLDQMPMTYIETAEFDCLRDAAILYAEKLEECGVDVELNNTRQTMHAYDIEKNSVIVDQSMYRRVQFLNRVWKRA